jgi:hypothetical protein
VNSSGTVQSHISGVYTITYSATDSSGNRAISQARTIEVVALASTGTLTLTGIVLASQTGGIQISSGARIATDGMITLKNSSIQISSPSVSMSISGSLSLSVASGTWDTSFIEPYVVSG